jgi:hypothetical protein
MKKVKVYYGDLSQADFEKFLSHMILCMTGNANFPTPTVPIADIISLKADWIKQLSLSQQGNHEATTNANNLHGDLAGKVRKNGNYINDTAEGDVAKLESSGYTLVKESVYQPKADVKVVQGENSGSGNVVIEAIPDAICYLVEFAGDPCPPPDSREWNRLKMSSKATVPFSGLEPRRLYWLRFCYLTIESEKPYCQPKSFSVL